MIQMHFLAQAGSRFAILNFTLLNGGRVTVQEVGTRVTIVYIDILVKPLPYQK
jgi:hypothetical protein